jgi:FkbM family methyltransferase
VIRNILTRKEAKQQDSSRSFSQSGEDLIIDFILNNHFATIQPSYLDIGAYDPVKFSNTYLFYERGCSGVLIEPDPDLSANLAKTRPRDRVLNIGVSDKESESDFYLVSPATLNTFSKKEFDQYKIFYPGTTLREIVKTKTKRIGSILDAHFKGGLDLLSIDVEGLDYQIISSINFKKHRPTVICVESVEYANGNTLIKTNGLSKLLFSKNYFLYADTFINSIFVDRQRWSDASQPLLKNFEGR